MNRLDKELLKRHLVPSRAQASLAIEAGYVSVNGRLVEKSSHKVSAEDLITIDDPYAHYVSRGAQKLLAILEADISGKIALDIGASTGGFTQVLLERGAAHIFAIDVGHGQLHPKIAGDARVVSVENFNIKDISPSCITHELWPNFEVITCDLSFISLRKALPNALRLAKLNCQIFALIKPQFELEPSDIGKGGIVKSEEKHHHAQQSVVHFFEENGWNMIKTKPSPILGGDGNTEFLLHAIKVKNDL